MDQETNTTHGSQERDPQQNITINADTINAHRTVNITHHHYDPTPDKTAEKSKLSEMLKLSLTAALSVALSVEATLKFDSVIEFRNKIAHAVGASPVDTQNMKQNQQTTKPPASEKETPPQPSAANTKHSGKETSHISAEKPPTIKGSNPSQNASLERLLSKIKLTEDFCDKNMDTLYDMHEPRDLYGECKKILSTPSQKKPLSPEEAPAEPMEIKPA